MCIDDIVHPMRHQSSIQESLNSLGESGQKGSAFSVDKNDKCFSVTEISGGTILIFQGMTNASVFTRLHIKRECV